MQLADEESKLKGFNWQPEKRPADRNAVTPLSLRPSQRKSYTARPKAEFRQTDIYFPGYMNDVYRQIEVKDSLRQARERERAIAERQAEERARLDSLALRDSLMVDADSLAVGVDSLSVADSLLVGVDSLAISDTLRPALKDSLGKVVPEVSDSLAVNDTTAANVHTPEEQAALKKAQEERLKAEAKAEKEKLKAEKKAALEEKKKKKQEEREARWAELDKRDADKAAAKEAKRLEKERKRKRKALEDAARQAEKDAAALEKFRLKYEKKKAKEDAKAARKAERLASRQQK